MDEIPALDEITPENTTAVNAVKAAVAAYNALSADQKAQFPAEKLAKLQAAAEKAGVTAPVVPGPEVSSASIKVPTVKIPAAELDTLSNEEEGTVVYSKEGLSEGNYTLVLEDGTEVEATYAPAEDGYPALVSAEVDANAVVKELVGSPEERITKTNDTFNIKLVAGDTLESLKAAATGTVTADAVAIVKTEAGEKRAEVSLAKDGDLIKVVLDTLTQANQTVDTLAGDTFTVELYTPVAEGEELSTPSKTYTIVFSELN